jgi:hypothetical protein
MAIVQTRPKDLAILNLETDETPLSEIVLMLDHPSWPTPKQLPYNFESLFPDWADATEVEILSLLGVADVVQSSDLTGYKTIEPGKSLVADTEITKLGLLIAPQVISLTASGSVAGKISGATKPSGWTLTASDTNLIISHTLPGKQLAGIIVKETNGSIKRVCVPFEDAYTGITENGTDITIEGINPVALALTVILTFV